MNKTAFNKGFATGNTLLAWNEFLTIELWFVGVAEGSDKDEVEIKLRQGHWVLIKVLCEQTRELTHFLDYV